MMYGSFFLRADAGRGAELHGPRFDNLLTPDLSQEREGGGIVRTVSWLDQYVWLGGAFISIRIHNAC